MDEENNYNVSEQRTGRFLLNLERSPIDKRDFVAESIYSEDIAVPKSLDLRPYLQPITNQGSQGTCSAQVAACMQEFQARKELNLTGTDDKFSPQFVYNFRGEPGLSGMTPRETMKILHKDGVCREFLYEYGLIQLPGQMSTDALNDAQNFKIQNYAQISTIEGLKKALVKDGVCYICFPVFNESPRMWKAAQGETDKGGHAMSVVGFNNSGFIIRNSWGDRWADNGYTIYPYEDWGAHWEIWTTIDAESFLPEFDAADYIRPIKASHLLWASAGILLLWNFFFKDK